MEMGADDYITKPFDDSELLGAVEARLKRLDLLDQKYPSNATGLTDFIKDVKASGLLSQLSEKYDMYTFQKRLTIYHEGKRPRFLYYLNKGKVKCLKVHEDG